MPAALAADAGGQAVKYIVVDLFLTPELEISYA
jgi:hypothetical protein